jgi:AraC family transcriptional activator of pyochelin receptor
MDTIDYLRLREPEYLDAVWGNDPFAAREFYADGSAVSYRSGHGSAPLTQEIVWVEDDFLLLFGSKYKSAPVTQRQDVRDGDWIHVKFQVKGTSTEIVDAGAPVSTPPGSCVVTRYRRGSVIEHHQQADTEWQTACLYFRPELVRTRLSTTVASGRLAVLLGAPASRRPVEFTIEPRESLVITDIFSCPFRGDVRKSYLRAKATELFTLSLHRVAQSGDPVSEAILTDDDRERIMRVRRIMEAEMGRQMTLEQLAHRVNINRSKLATGFKLMFGDTLQAYWRDMRLTRARELIAVEQWSVTDVATTVGYDVSALTRAFERRFGVRPKDCRSRRNDFGFGAPESITRSA